MDNYVHSKYTIVDSPFKKVLSFFPFTWRDCALNVRLYKINFLLQIKHAGYYFDFDHRVRVSSQTS